MSFLSEIKSSLKLSIVALIERVADGRLVKTERYLQLCETERRIEQIENVKRSVIETESMKTKIAVYEERIKDLNTVLFQNKGRPSKNE